MIRRIHCIACGAGQEHPEDVAEGWKRRVIQGVVHKPDVHEIHIRSGTPWAPTGPETVIPLPSLMCDLCGEPIPDGTKAMAITQWKGETEPLLWEREFMRSL